MQQRYSFSLRGGGVAWPAKMCARWDDADKLEATQVNNITLQMSIGVIKL